jgi:ribonuclease inhibitor
LHEQVALHPETPDYYGRNLNALFDVLVGYYESPVEVRWFHADVARKNLGDRFDLILELLADAEKQWQSHGGSFSYELIANKEGQ